MNEIPRRIKRQLRELAAVAHDRELRKALDDLAASFDRFKAGELDSAQLNDVIHEFHDGRSRELYKRYNYAPLTSCVAYAIAAGVIEKRSVPDEVLQFLQGLIELHEWDIRRSSPTTG